MNKMSGLGIITPRILGLLPISNLFCVRHVIKSSILYIYFILSSIIDHPTYSILPFRSYLLNKKKRQERYMLVLFHFHRFHRLYGLYESYRSFIIQTVLMGCDSKGNHHTVDTYCRLEHSDEGLEVLDGPPRTKRGKISGLG